MTMNTQIHYELNPGSERGIEKENDFPSTINKTTTQNIYLD